MPSFLLVITTLGGVNVPTTRRHDLSDMNAPFFFPNKQLDTFSKWPFIFFFFLFNFFL